MPFFKHHIGLLLVALGCVCQGTRSLFGAGIHLKKIHPATMTKVATGVQTSIQNNLVGILVEFGL